MVLYIGALNLHLQGQWAAHAIPTATLPDPELVSGWEGLLLKEKPKSQEDQQLSKYWIWKEKA